MPGGSSVLKEFLVKIGFKVDEAKFRHFQEAMHTTAKNAVEMSKTALESAANRAQSGAQVAPGFIGLTPIDKVDPQPDGSTLLYVSDARTLLTPCGLVYNPHGVPNVESFHDSAGGYSVSDSSFATNWWLFCENY